MSCPVRPEGTQSVTVTSGRPQSIGGLHVLTHKMGVTTQASGLPTGGGVGEGSCGDSGGARAPPPGPCDTLGRPQPPGPCRGSVCCSGLGGWLWNGGCRAHLQGLLHEGQQEAPMADGQPELLAPEGFLTPPDSPPPTGTNPEASSTQGARKSPCALLSLWVPVGGSPDGMWGTQPGASPGPADRVLVTGVSCRTGTLRSSPQRPGPLVLGGTPVCEVTPGQPVPGLGSGAEHRGGACDKCTSQPGGQCPWG